MKHVTKERAKRGEKIIGIIDDFDHDTVNILNADESILTHISTDLLGKSGLDAIQEIGTGEIVEIHFTDKGTCEISELEDFPQDAK